MKEKLTAVYEVKVEALDTSIDPETNKASGYMRPDAYNVAASNAKSAVEKAKKQVVRDYKVNPDITEARLHSVTKITDIDLV